MRPRQLPGPLELLFPGERVLEAMPRKPPVPARPSIKIFVSRLRLRLQTVWRRLLFQVLAAGPSYGLNLRAAVERPATHPLLIFVLLFALPRKRAKGRGLGPRLPGSLVLLPRPWELPSALVKPRELGNSHHSFLPRVLGRATQLLSVSCRLTGLRLQDKYGSEAGRQSGHQRVRTTPCRRPLVSGRMRPSQRD